MLGKLLALLVEEFSDATIATLSRVLGNAEPQKEKNLEDAKEKL